MRKTFIIFILSISFFSLATFAEAKQNYQDFDFTTIGFHGLYVLEISEENGQTVARSIYDLIDSPHYIFNKEKNAWEDNHPGRNDIELLFPPVRVSGRTIWKELAGYEWIEETKNYLENDLNRAVWNQDMLAYEYINIPHDQGHPVFWLPMMSIDVDGISDEKKGRVNLAESIESEDFILGVSGVRLDFYISTNHPDIEYWIHNPEDLFDIYYSEMYLENYPWIKGKHIQIKWIEEDITAKGQIANLNNRKEIFFQEDFTTIVDFEVSGYTNIIPNELDIITFSAPHGIKSLSAVSVPHYIGIVAMSIKENGKIHIPNGVDYQKILSSAMIFVFEESKFTQKTDMVFVKFK